jgi:hypothetical protein
MDRVERSQFRGLLFSSGLDRNGSFRSVEDARDLISRTLALNQAEVAQVAEGRRADAFVIHRFGFVTGREAVIEPLGSPIRMRPTYEVGVEILHDANRPEGYRVVTAYPRNYNPRTGR